MRNILLSSIIVGLCVVAPASAQQSPFLPDPVYRVLVNEISGDVSYEHVRYFTHFHRPTAGSEGFEAVAKYIEQKAKEYGLEDVRRIHVRSDAEAWKANAAELRLIEPFERRLAFSPEVQLSLADNSRSADIKSAELVDVGDGTAESDYAGKEVKGKVVLTTGSPAVVMNEAVWKRGALGLVVVSTARAVDYPDQLSWMRIPLANADGTKKGTFGFVLSPREGQRLRRELSLSKTPLKVSVKIDAGFTQPPFQSFVEAVIRGTDIHDQDIVLTGHIQEERFSANDDGSGLANVLEIGRALKKAIDEGRLPRPKRDIRFWWCDEIGGEEQFFANFPDERKQILANINQDMVGALQSAGSRVQFVSREPWSRASFLGDVVESVLMALVAGNTAYLSPGQVPQPAGGLPADGLLVPGLSYTRPILSPLGTRERFDARMIPFHNNTDSQVFNMGVVGIPAVTFTNWPDDFIHSTGDDLWQVDATQMERNAVAIAGATWFLATAGDAQVPVLATHMYGRALERMSRDARIAMEMIDAVAAGQAAATARRDVVPASAAGGVGPGNAEFAGASGRAWALVAEAARRERRAMESARVFARPGGNGAAVLQGLLAQLPSEEDALKRLSSYQLGLQRAYGIDIPGVVASGAGLRARGGGVHTDAPPSTLGMVPVVTDSVKQFLELRGKIERPRGLHPLMQYEALNYADGKRTVREIVSAVGAEADSAGDWYYGTVEQDDVVKLFESAAKVGLVTLQERR